MRFSISSLLGISTWSLFLLSVRSVEDILPRDFHASQQILSKHSDPNIVGIVQQVLAAYGLFLDTQNYEALRAVFTDDVVTNVFGDITTGIDPLIAGYKDSRPFFSQHSSTNEVIVAISEHHLKVISYNTAYFFGEGRRRPGSDARGPDASQLLTFWDKFEDIFVKRGGHWKISHRNVTGLVSILHRGQSQEL